ncbi:PRC-barrel domain-containing protein [Palleronia abyssalis]|uniref:PRC-barrel domain-containing protein n=1 Tax=Palleronia abyssalis TaxID=1501240 RepID=A0A2R8BR35_9RHOB|nr:PRC-barrel domain-containing protein [Palleronia abyssalis]SPJ22619.1 hypothetical protein PAA8504_00414 [Palleronia abyssalis]
MLRKPVIAAAILFALPAAAQDAASFSEDAAAPDPQNIITAEMLEDARVVSLEGNYDQDVWDDSAPLSAMVANLTEIGGVEDVVLSVDGQMLGLTTDVGGFIGIGDKTVMIPLEDIRLVRPADGSDITIVTRLGMEPLQDLPEFEIED